MSNKKNKIIRFLAQLPEDKLVALLKLYKNQQEKEKSTLQKNDMIFDVVTVPSEIEREVKYYEKCDNEQITAHLMKWIETIKAMPRRTSPLPRLDSEFLNHADAVWKSKIRGLEDIYKKLMPHVIEYLSTGRTRPILFVGTPGCGKTMAMRVMGEILEMPLYFANAPQMAKGNGLSGIGKTYIAAAPGEPVEAMVSCKSGNLIFAIDEVDKTMRFAGHGGDFQDELLNLTSDETAHMLKDNFLGFTVDASHLFVIMTANDLNDVSAPLKSRCDVITFPEPGEALISEIIRTNAVPTLLTKLHCEDKVSVSEDAINYAVTTLFRSGVRDMRIYQSLMESAINTAVYDSIRGESTITITIDDLTPLIGDKSNACGSVIGFCPPSCAS